MGAPDGLFELVYISAATRPFSRLELQSLLAAARANNLKLGVTGILLSAQNSFLQILEGPESVVTRLFETITRDPRHTRVLRLFLTPIEARSFGDWTMGFVDGGAAGLELMPGFNDFFRAGFERAKFVGEGGSNRAREIALQFRQGRWRQFAQ